MSAQKALSKDFEDMVKNYLVNCSTVQNELNTRNTSPELEIRFGTNPKKSKPITSVDYQNVVKQLGMNGWKTHKIEGVQMLRIIPNRIGLKLPTSIIRVASSYFSKLQKRLSAICSQAQFSQTEAEQRLTNGRIVLSTLYSSGTCFILRYDRSAQKKQGVLHRRRVTYD